MEFCPNSRCSSCSLLCVALIKKNGHAHCYKQVFLKAYKLSLMAMMPLISPNWMVCFSNKMLTSNLCKPNFFILKCTKKLIRPDNNLKPVLLSSYFQIKKCLFCFHSTSNLKLSVTCTIACYPLHFMTESQEITIILVKLRKCPQSVSAWECFF